MHVDVREIVLSMHACLVCVCVCVCVKERERESEKALTVQPIFASADPSAEATAPI